MFFRLLYIENGPVVIPAGMAWFLFMDADIFLFSETEATVK